MTKPCKATASSGAIKCEIGRDHAGHHSSLKPGQKKTSQHVTWTTIADGRVEVTTYRGGKKDGNWFEGEARAAEPVQAPDADEDACSLCGVSPCACDENDDPLEDEVRSDADRELARQMREEREAHAAALENAPKAPSLTDLCPKCNRELGEHDGKKCPKPEKAKVSKIYTKAEREQMERPAVPAPRRSRYDKAGPLTPEEIAELPSGPPGIKVHPAADALPMIEGPELDALVADIRTNGLRHRPVLDHSGEWLVDGRNRDRARQVLGMELTYDRLPEGTNIAAYVISTNLKRRHLTESQRAMIAAQIANLAQGHKKQTGTSSGVTQSEAASGAGVSDRLVRRAVLVRDNAVPELVAAVKAGKVDLKGAEQVAKLSPAKQREIVKERIDTSKGPVRGGKLASLARQEERRDVVRKINGGSLPSLSTLTSSFGVLLWDPPWDYDNSDDHDSARGHIKYPSMSHEQLVELGREALTRLRDDAVIVTWATNPRMPAAVHLVEALGLTWQSMGTWVKERIGVAPTNMRSRTEHYIIATRGKPVHTLNEVSTWLGDRPIDRTSNHSEKPGELHELLEAHCSGPYLEIFARAPRDRWSTWGAEADKFAATEAA